MCICTGSLTCLNFDTQRLPYHHLLSSQHSDIQERIPALHAWKANISSQTCFLLLPHMRSSHSEEPLLST